jgi:hypothetical protein
MALPLRKESAMQVLKRRFGYLPCYACVLHAATLDGIVLLNNPHRLASEAIAHAIPAFSFDIVGVVGEYAREWRLLRMLNLGADPSLENELRDKGGHARGTNWRKQRDDDRNRAKFIAVRDERIYVSDTKTLRVFTMDGTFSYTLDGVSEPCGIAFDAQGKMFVADNALRYPPSIKCFWQNRDRYGSMRYFSHAPVNNPTGICCSNDGNVYVCCRASVEVLDFGGLSLGHLRANSPERECQARSIAISATHAFVTNGYDHFDIFKLNGILVSRVGRQGSGFGQFDQPTGVAYHAKNERVLVCDSGNRRMQTFSVDGNYGNFMESVSLPYAPFDVCVEDNGTGTGSGADDLVYVLGENVVSVFAY